MALPCGISRRECELLISTPTRADYILIGASGQGGYADAPKPIAGLGTGDPTVAALYLQPGYAPCLVPAEPGVLVADGSTCARK